MAKFKVTLSTGKVVVMEDLTIKLKNLAIEASSAKTSSQGNAFNSIFQDEMLRLLIVSVNGKPLGAVEREDFDSFLTFAEYQSIMVCMQDMMGDPKEKKPKIEILTGNSSPGSHATPA